MVVRVLHPPFKWPGMGPLDLCKRLHSCQKICISNICVLYALSSSNMYCVMCVLCMHSTQYYAMLYAGVQSHAHSIYIPREYNTMFIHSSNDTILV